tara:strand:- start:29 stop:544 length:516 start_codon:yes stop_codon:yes gene_type:complete
MFTDLIGAEFKKLHKDMIDGLLSDTSLTVLCTLYYASTKFTDCPNCIYSPIQHRSSNKYEPGGPIPFYHGICPYCNGRGRTQSSSEEDLYLCALWDSKDWYPLSQNNVNMADIDVQTFSKLDTYTKLKKANKIDINTSIKNLGFPSFVRIGDPEPCGLGQASHIATAWKRA